MRYLFYLLRKHYFYFLFLFLEVIALVMFFTFNEFQNSAIARVTNTISGSVQLVASNVSGYFSLRSKNQMLSEDNARLHSRLPDAFYRADSNSFYISDTLYETEYRYISARVISNTTNQRNNFLMLGKGKKQGIENHMGVIVGNRIVGQVVSVSDHFSWVMSVLNKDTRISGKFRKNDQLVNVEWNGGNYRIGSVREIPKHVEINPGDTIITSGNSDIFPEGILIGTIRDFTITRDENFNNATIYFATDFNSLSYIEVIIDLMRKEKEELKASFSNSTR
jgi:rod shape-determining protein MreC